MDSICRHGGPCKPNTREAEAGLLKSALRQLRLHKRLRPGKQGGARLGKATVAKPGSLTGPSGHAGGEISLGVTPDPHLLLQNHKCLTP